MTREEAVDEIKTLFKFHMDKLAGPNIERQMSNLTIYKGKLIHNVDDVNKFNKYLIECTRYITSIEFNVLPYVDALFFTGDLLSMHECFEHNYWY